MYYNTTTIPTEYIDTTPSILSALGFGLFFTLTFCKFIMEELFDDYEKDENEESSEEEDDDEDNNEAVIDTSITDFSNLLDRELNEEELQQLQFKIVRETTAIGDIVMTYHKETESFWYYANNLKDVNYSMLETVARKFAIANDCKRIYIQTAAEEEEHKQEEQEEHKQAEEEHKQALHIDTKNVFAKFKKYNSGGKGSNPNFKAIVKVIEQANHFRYKGKLNAYDFLLKERNEKEKAKASPILDYAAYRDLLRGKEEN